MCHSVDQPAGRALSANERFGHDHFDAATAKFAADHQVNLSAVAQPTESIKNKAGVSVIELDDADQYREVAKIPIMNGAKTAILDAVNRHLWVAVSRAKNGEMGKVLGQRKSNISAHRTQRGTLTV